MVLTVLMAAAALSQAAPAQAPQPDATFKAGVELVRLDVRVTDSDGRPVKDLRQEEVEVVDGRTRLPIVLFQHVEEPSESFAEVASHTIAGEVSTNQGAARGQLYLLLFDQLHITPGNEQRARLAAQRFVTTRIRPGDRVALYALPGPGPQIPFTSDTRRVANALAEIHGTGDRQGYGALGASMTIEESFEILRGNETILQRVADRVQAQGLSDAPNRNSPADFGTGTMPLTELVKEDARKIRDLADGQSRSALARIADLLRGLRTIEGPKTILLISEGFEGDRLTAEIDDVSGAAAESYSVIHSFDINRREVDVTSNEPVGADQANGIQDRLSPLGTLATETGGTLVLNVATRADQAFASIADRSRDYYLVGFTPAAAALGKRGEYRRVSIRVKRPGARVSTRTGFTLADHAASMDRQQSIQRGLAAPFPIQGLPVEYTTYVIAGRATGAHTVLLSLATDLPAASPRENRPADIVFIVRAVSDGRVAASGKDTIPLPASNARTAFRVQFDLVPGEYLMRVLVREPGGLVGTADRRFSVRAFDGPAIESGDLFLSTPVGLPVRASAYTDDGLSGFVEIYGRTQSQLEDSRVIVDLIPAGDSSAVVSGEAELGAIRSTGRGVAREARFALPIASVTPGAYIARARVLAGGETASQTGRDVDVRLGNRPDRSAQATASSAFEPRDVVGSALVSNYVARLGNSSWAGDARRGIERLGAADYAAAIASFDTVLGADSRNAVAAFLQGWAYHGAGEDRLAISAWRRAAYVDPTLVPAHLALADLFVTLQQPALALQAVRAGLTALPESPELLDRLSRLEKR